MFMRSFAALVVAGALAACGSGTTTPDASETMMPPLTEAQALEDLDTVLAQVKRLYGPLRFKEQKFGYTLDGLATKARDEIKAGKSDEERLGAIVKLLAAFEDGHVSIQFPGNATEVRQYKIGIFLTPVEGKALVADVNPALADLGVSNGDVLVQIDGQDPWALMPTIKKYEALANDVSDQHWIYKVLSRPFYMSELKPTSATASLTFERADGSRYHVAPMWTKAPYQTKTIDPIGRPMHNFHVPAAAAFNEAAKGTIAEFGNYRPFFVTAQTTEAFSLVEVEPNAAYLGKYGVKREELVDNGELAIYAALYKHNGKTVLLVRQPGYWLPIDAAKLMNGYRALFDQFDDIADVMLLDQTHNPGGSLMYVANLFSLFLQDARPNLVQYMNADRRWIYDLQAWATEFDATMPSFATTLRLRANLVDQALEQGKAMTEPMPLMGYEKLEPDTQYTWKKKVLVMADELAGSCGDIFPMLMKRGGVAKIFGERTMGLGGNVEEVVKLPNSQASVNLTRGLFLSWKPEGYTADDIVENAGITPDIHRPLTLEDARGGFVGYLKAASDAVTSL